uniref:Erbb2 interacting protein n=1 Tax=Taenia asiatica TaxID=60517 RepID=A0A0R3W010_TAEAS
LMQQRQQQQQQQQNQQLYLRSPDASIPMASTAQCLKSTSLRSPTRFAQITAAPGFTPSAVVFRNYRVTGAESNYQTAGSSMPSQKHTFQQPDCQYTSSGGGVGGGGACMSSNNSSLLSKTSDLIDTSGEMIRMSDTSNGKCGRQGENSSEFSDAIPQDVSPSSYQRLLHEGGAPTAVSQYVIHLPNSCSPLTFENHHPMEVHKKRGICPLSPTSGGVANFVTPTHLGRPATTGRPFFRSRSIDSNLDNLSSSLYHPVMFSPGDTTREDRSLHQGVAPPPLAAPEKRLNFITNTKTLSPEIRGSFV